MVFKHERLVATVVAKVLERTMRVSYSRSSCHMRQASLGRQLGLLSGCVNKNECRELRLMSIRQGCLNRFCAL